MALSSSLAFHGGELFFATMVSTEQEANPWCHDPAMSGEPPATCTFRHWRAKTGTNETPVPFGPDVQRGIPGHASDETRLYWTECDEVGGTIHYLEDGNPDPQLLLQFGTPCGGELAVEPGPEGLVFWTGSNGIYRATKTGQNLGPLVDAEGPFSLLADGKHVYWIEGSNFFEGPEEDGSVRRVSRDGGPAVTLAPTHKPGALAQDCAAVYWTNTFLLFQPEQYIEIRKVSK
ncbi:MAG: hypothetical protein R3F14_28760 [Polyangiaceae bacterium]